VITADRSLSPVKQSANVSGAIWMLMIQRSGSIHEGFKGGGKILVGAIGPIQTAQRLGLQLQTTLQSFNLWEHCHPF